MEIITHKSFGPIRFGDSRAEVRRNLGVPVTTFLKANQPPEVDAFDRLGIHVHYDSDDRAEFVEAAEAVDVTFRGIDFLGRNLEDVAKQMAALGFTPDDDECGLAYYEAGVAVYAPTKRVEAVSGFRRGYYDDLAKLLDDLEG